MDICQITLITLSQKFLLVAPDTLSETLLCSTQLLGMNMRDTHCIISVCEKLQATRAKVAPVNLIYGSHFSVTEATYEMSQNIVNFIEFTKNIYKN